MNEWSSDVVGLHFKASLPAAALSLTVLEGLRGTVALLPHWGGWMEEAFLPKLPAKHFHASINIYNFSYKECNSVNKIICHLLTLTKGNA